MLKEKFDVVGVVHDGRALLSAIDNLRPDVIVTDISMPNLNGLDAIRQIRAERPNAKIIVLTMHAEGNLAADAFRAGALGYLLKVSPAEELVKAIGEVAQGRAYLTTLVAKDMLSLLMQPEPRAEDGMPLTVRQREVLQLVAEGRTMKEIASALHISPRTAESHKYEIMRLLGAKTTAELIQYALRTKSI